MKSPGIHFRLLLAVFTLISATTFALGYMGIHISRQFMLTRFENRISFLARYLALNAELGILIDDRSMLERLGGNLLSEKDVVGVTIVDEMGRKLVDISVEGNGPVSTVETPVILKETGEEGETFTWDKNFAVVRTEIGKVRISYSTGGIDQVLTTMRDRFIWLFAGLASLSIVVFYFLSRSLVAPVSRLAREARQVAEGDLQLRARPGGLPETRGLALAFNAMLDSLEENRNALQEANDRIMRQNLLAEMGKVSLMIAHEVKNPLGIIKSSLDVLKKNPAISPDDTFVSYMEDEIKRLNRLMEDFLAFARPARPSFRPSDMNGLLLETVRRFELQKAGLPFEVRTHVPSEPCVGTVDPDLLARAIGNILGNALEANNDRGVVKVAATCLHGAWRVTIEDEGRGIDPQNIDKIFEPFFTTRSKGTGLGLAYASQVISTHRGTIRAANGRDGGARFEVEIPHDLLTTDH